MYSKNSESWLTNLISFIPSACLHQHLCYEVETRLHASPRAAALMGAPLSTLTACGTSVITWFYATATEPKQQRRKRREETRRDQEMHSKSAKTQRGRMS